MLINITKKILSKILVLFIVTVMVFVLANISRVDPAESHVRRTGIMATQEQIEEVRENLGLNKPISVQYAYWLKNIIKGDFGTSLITGNKVLDDIKVTIGPTVLLVTVSTLLAIITGTLVGVYCSIKKEGIVDSGIRFITLTGISVPNFWIGFLLLFYFSVHLKWVPVVSQVNLKCLVLPAITMAIVPSAQYIKLIRNNILDNLKRDYVLYSMARGLPMTRIIVRQVLKNAIQPLIPLFFQNFAYLLIGSAIIEVVFTWPGMGLYMTNAVLGRDFEVVAFYVLLSAVVFSVCGIVSDVINAKLNKQLMIGNS